MYEIWKSRMRILFGLLVVERIFMRLCSCDELKRNSKYIAQRIDHMKALVAF